MRPEDIDDLFKKKLGDLRPTPSAEAWQRLQEQLQPETKKRVIPMWWSVAATLAFLILMGTYFYANLRPGSAPAPVAEVSQPNRGPQSEQPNQEPAIAAKEVAPTQQPSMAATDKLAQAEKPDPAGEKDLPAALAPSQTSRTSRLAQAAPVAPSRPQTEPEDTRNQNRAAPEQLAMRSAAELPSPKTLAAPAPEVIEVVILKNEPALALAPDAETEMAETETSAKGKVVKGLLRQVKNLATGQQVELPNLNPNNYSIAFETQIGNRKISKTINF